MGGLLRWSSQWWPGLVPLAVFWTVAALNSTASVEADLRARSAEAVKDVALDRTRISVDGRDVSFGADALSEEGRLGALAAVRAVPGVRLVNDETRLVPEAKPFEWSAEREVARIVLAGNAPLPAVKDRLLEAARGAVNGVEVVDQMVLARGAPAQFDEAALLLTAQIGKLKDGRLAISDGRVTLSGMAREIGGREAVIAALKDLPPGFSVAASDVEAPPYIFQANKDPVALTLTLSGYLPDARAHGAIIAAAGRKFFNEKVVDNLKTSVGAPPGFASVVIAALGALSRLSTATLVVSDRNIRLSGDALYDAAVPQIRASLQDLSRDFVVDEDISVKPASAPVDAGVCQELLSEILARGKIRFLSNRAAIDPDSAGLIDQVIETALRCPAATIEIVGHGDSRDTSANGQALPEKRAQAVLDQLVKAGLPAERFTATGSTELPAADDPGQGRVRNRRIELLVR